MSKIQIYTLDCPDENIPKYVGVTIRKLETRLVEHIYSGNRKGKKNLKSSWIKGLLNKGKKPLINLLDIVEEKDWQFWEQYYISLFKSFGFKLKNSDDGGYRRITFFTSEETKKKISLKMKCHPSLKKKKGPMSILHKNKIKKSSLLTFKEKCNITDELIKQIYINIDINGFSMRKTARVLNSTYNRVRSVYKLKKY